MVDILVDSTEEAFDISHLLSGNHVLGATRVCQLCCSSTGLLPPLELRVTWLSAPLTLLAFISKAFAVHMVCGCHGN